MRGCRQRHAPAEGLSSLFSEAYNSRVSVYTVRVVMPGGEVLVQVNGDNRWNVLEPGDMREKERDALVRRLAVAGDMGEPWPGGFPEETSFADGVLRRYPGSRVVAVDPPFEEEEGVVY